MNDPSTEEIPWSRSVWVQRIVAVAILIVLALLVVGLVASFVVIDKQSFFRQVEVNNVNRSAGCSNYTYSVCRKELIAIQDALLTANTTKDNLISISSSVDQKMSEDIAELLFYGFDYIPAPNECKSLIFSFLCLTLFPLCDQNGTILEQSAEDCNLVTMETCKEQWTALTSLPAIGVRATVIGDCSRFSNTSAPVLTALNGTKQQTAFTDDLSSERPKCMENFFLSNETCIPRCDKWDQCSSYATTISTVTDIMSSLAIILGGSAILVFSCVDRTRMFAFPLVMMLNFTVFLMLDTVTILVSYVDRRLYCSSENLLEALITPTAFCSVIQSLRFYFETGLGITWLSYVTTLFWQTTFPFRARMCKINGLNKYIYGGALLAAVTIPAVIIASVYLTGGFFTLNFSPTVCWIRNPDTAFYAAIFPPSMVLLVAATLMAFAIMTLFKHRKSKSNSSSSNVIPQISTAERKVFLVFCHYLVFSLVTIALVRLFVTPDEQLVKNIYAYLHCESKGHSRCSKDTFGCDNVAYTATFVVHRILWGSIPLVVLYLVIPSEKAVRFFRNRVKNTTPAT